MTQAILCTRKGLFIYTLAQGQARPMSRHFLGDPVSAFTIDAAGTWYAALNLGHFGPKLHRSNDQGVSWQPVACPAFPNQEAEDDSQAKVPVVTQIWIMEPLADTPGAVLAGTNEAALFRTDDSGDSWQLNQPLFDVPQRVNWSGGGFDESGVHSIAVNPNNPDQWTLAISVGGVWHTQDAGKHWQLKCAGMRAAYMPEDMAFDEAMQDPHRLVQSLSHPNRMWVQHHNGIFVSDDHGGHWREVLVDGEPSFGFGVVVHPTMPDTAWFVPAVKDESRFPKDGKFRVLRTDDAGDSFKVQANGLPDTDGWDLVYRHALAIDSTGHCLAMASTTGDFWFTENGGELWHLANAHLPPVYAVHLV